MLATSSSEEKKANCVKSKKVQYSVCAAINIFIYTVYLLTYATVDELHTHTKKTIGERKL